MIEILLSDGKGKITADNFKKKSTINEDHLLKMLNSENSFVEFIFANKIEILRKERIQRITITVG